METRLLLPRHFISTHPTEGLPGFPALDCFAKGGTYVCAEFDAVVVKLSGHPITPTVTPGGPYGLSTYLALRWDRAAGAWADVYYGTHFGSRAKQHIVVGSKLKKGMLLGRVADYAKATGGVTPSHIHWGFHPGPWTP